jgi:hypothetical protein
VLVGGFQPEEDPPFCALGKQLSDNALDVLVAKYSLVQQTATSHGDLTSENFMSEVIVGTISGKVELSVDLFPSQRQGWSYSWDGSCNSHKTMHRFCILCFQRSANGLDCVACDNSQTFQVRSSKRHNLQVTGSGSAAGCVLRPKKARRWRSSSSPHSVPKPKLSTPFCLSRS